MARENKKQQKKRRKKKKKVNKLFVSAAAFFTAAAIVVFCIYYVYFNTPYFNLIAINTSGNNVYEDNYIIEKSGINLGQKLFSINRAAVKGNLQKEVYIKSARVIYDLPDTVNIEITEREEKYQIAYNNEYIITDIDGVVLNTYTEKNELLTIESLADVIYNKGVKIQFSGIDNINAIFDTLEYCNSEYGSDTITKLTVDRDNSIVLDTNYGTKIKINLKDDIKYQITFAMKIINDRLNNNLTVNADLIDFTKGDSPVYTEDYQLEEKNE